MPLMTRRQVSEVKLRTRIVDVPTWRTPDIASDEMPQVLVRGLMGDERDIYEQSLMRVSGMGKKTTQQFTLKGARARLAAMGLLNPDGSQMYDVNNHSDLKELGSKPADGLEAVIDAIMELSAIAKEEDAAEAQIEENAANFPSMVVNGSGTS